MIALLLLSVLVLWMVADEINVLWGPGRHGSALFGRAAYEAILQFAGLLCLARGALYASERRTWIAIGVACMSWGVGDIYYEFVLVHAKVLPVPSAADGAYLAFYPLMFVGVVLLFRARSGRAGATQWLDGLTAALAAGALSAAVALGAVLSSAGGTTLAAATNLAYPVGDLLLLGAIAGAVVVCGLRAGRVWLWVALGIGLFCLADAFYLVQSAHGTYRVGGWIDVGWPAGMVALAAAAWTSPRGDRITVLRGARRSGGRRQIALPILFALISIGLLLYTGSSHLNWVARILAAASLGVVLLRLAWTFSDHAKITAQREYDSKTDALTELGNRRALVADLASEVDGATADGQALLALFDLDGFKRYNDTFGHPAGDALLARLAERLQATMAGIGSAYRMGGDEFCVLARVQTDDGGEAFAALAAAALSDEGTGFRIRCSYGCALIPSEAQTPEQALGVADQRMYQHKASRSGAKRHESADLLIQVLAEQSADIGEHLGSVAHLAELTANRLGLPETEVAVVCLAAQLHDIGKVAIPDTILNKPGKLSDSEWEFMRRHTIIGERIVLAAPSLAHTASAVRASHERFDGTGYPDRLAGQQIPLAARIIAVCDAYDAMVSRRSYRATMSASEALDELCRCSGSQFDPEVTAAFTSLDMHLQPNPAPAVH